MDIHEDEVEGPFFYFLNGLFAINDADDLKIQGFEEVGKHVAIPRLIIDHKDGSLHGCDESMAQAGSLAGSIM